jgi:type II secretory pathway component PulK
MALLAVVVYLFIVTALSAAFFQTVHQTMDQARKAERRNQCLYLAEAGVEKAIAALRAYPEVYRSETDTTLGPGTFSVEVTPLAEAGAFRIRATGRLSGSASARDGCSLISEVAFSEGRVVRLREAEAKRW